MSVLLAEPSSLAMNLYLAQESLAVLVLVVIPFVAVTVVLTTAIVVQEAGRSAIQWGRKHSICCFARRATDSMRPGEEF
jgi:hypothetical protein